MYEIEPEIIELANGLRLVCLQKDTLVSHLGVSVLAGSRYETLHEEGIAHFIEHCIFKGTKKRKAYHILSRLDSVGGELNAYTTKEELVVYASFTNQHLNRAVELLSDLLFHSTFPSKEIEKEKEVILDELNSYLDTPGERIFDEFEAHLFQNHSLGGNILGRIETIRQFTKKDILNYIERYFTLKNMVVSYVGPKSTKQVQKLVSNYFTATSTREIKPKLPVFKPNKAFDIVEKIGNFQSHVIIGGLAPNYHDDARRAMTLLMNIIGGPALNSRLSLSIREKYGYSYNIEANFTPYVDTGFWTIYLGTDQKYLKKSIKLVQKELALFCNKELGVKQLNQAKEQLKGQIALSLEGNSGLMLGLGKSLLVFNHIDTIETIYNEIDAITSKDILETAQKYLNPKMQNKLVYEIKSDD